MSNHLTREHIEKLTSKFIYSKFEGGEGKCGDLSFFLDTMDDLKNNLIIRDISDKITKVLCYIYMKKPYHSKFQGDLCSYMYYWIGDKIYAKTSNIGDFRKIMKMLYDVLNITDKNMICKHFNYEIDRDTFYKNKLLFDYSQDHGNIKIDTAGYKTCNKDYKEYMEDYIRTYKDAYSNCYGKNENKYDCETFFSLFQRNQYDELSKFSCVPSENPKAKLEQTSVYGTEEHAQNQQFMETTEVQNSVDHRSTASDLNLESNPSTVFPQDPEKIQPVTIEHTAEGGSSKTIAGSIAPVLGVSSFSLLLYKVTPVGGFINRLLGRSRNTYNPVEYMDSFNPYSDGMDSGSRGMNISYHRM
ncbi:PIR protein [Plasmodium vivax]|uniref:VIR protein n=1 Tax=Plasmodium vivax TaxID=5855 RepID=A0A565A6C9_PLAVI|nr:PIR protein [Plasmodium vivax]